MHITRAILVLPCLLPLAGCLVAAAAGAAYGYIKYENNEATADFDAPVERVWRASLDALEGRNYRVPGGTSRSLDESQDSAEVEGDAYWLRVEEQPGKRTRVRVRMGTFETDENRRKAELLIESIKERL